MDKKKREQMILVVLMPIFFIGLLYMRSQQKSKVIDIVKKELTISQEDPLIDKLPRPKTIEEISYKKTEKDPLKNIFAQFLEKLRRRVSEKEIEKLPIPDLNIEGLIWNSDMPQAIINGSVIKIGDYIEGVKVIEIDKKGITIEYEGQKVLISKK